MLAWLTGPTCERRIVLSLSRGVENFDASQQFFFSEASKGSVPKHDWKKEAQLTSNV